MDPRGLIKFYNALVAVMVEGKFRPSYGRRGGFKSFSEKVLGEAAELLAWLEAQGFEPKPYLAGCFGTHNWCYQPKWGRLREKRYQDVYREGEAWRWWDLLAREDRFADKSEGLHPGHEIVKARYHAHGGAQPDRGLGLCYYNRLAGRFVAESKWCQLCVHKEVCR